MNRQRTQRRQPDPNWRMPVADLSRCAKTPDGKHRWITTYLPMVCDACLEIDEREAATR